MQKPQKNKQNKQTQHIASAVLVLVALSLLAVGAMQLRDKRVATTKPAELPLPSAVIVEDDKEPTETKPETNEYAVPADQPRRLLLPIIDTEALIQRVGLNSKKAISVPDNIHFGGWFVDSVKPGYQGLSIIDGHVSGAYNDGVFKGLHLLKSGDRFQVEYGDGSIRNFEVIEVKTVPETESSVVLFTHRADIPSQLNLITCGGKFDRNTQLYDDRVIVVAKAIPAE